MCLCSLFRFVFICQKVIWVFIYIISLLNNILDMNNGEFMWIWGVLLLLAIMIVEIKYLQHFVKEV